MIQVFAEGLAFPDAPCWSSRDNCLYVVEKSGDRVDVLREDRAQVLFAMGNGSAPGGLCQDKDDNFWVCLSSGLKLARFSRTGALLQTIDSFRSAPFRGPNDLAQDASEGIYFTDGGNFEGDWVSGRPAGSLFYLDPSGTLSRLDKGLCYPSGIAVSLDGQFLFVNEHRKNRILQYRILAPGRVSDRAVLCSLDRQCLLEADHAYELGPDGMGLDQTGCLWVAHYGGGKLILVSPQGTVLQSIPLPRGRKPTSVKYSSPEKALYVTEAEFGLLYRIDWEGEPHRPLVENPA
jgi:gluconolactonase